MTTDIATIEKNKTEELRVALKEFKGRGTATLRNSRLGGAVLRPFRKRHDP